MRRHTLTTLLAYASSCGSDLPPVSPSTPTSEPVTPVFGEVRCGMPWPEPVTRGAPLYVAQRPATLGGAPIEATLLLACGGKVAGIAGERVFVRTASDRSIVDDTPPEIVDDPVEAAIALAAGVRDASLRQGFAQAGVLGGGLAEALADRATAPTPGRPPPLQEVRAALREQPLETTLRAHTEAIHFTQLVHEALARTIDVRCRARRCTVSVTEELVACDAPGGMAPAQLRPEAP